MNPEDTFELDGVEMRGGEPVMRRFRVTLNGGLQGIYRAHFYETDSAGTLTFVTQDAEGRYWHRLSINGRSWQEIAELTEVELPPVPDMVGLVPKGSPVH